MDTVKLSRLGSELDTLDYPVTRVDAAVAFEDTVVSFADGEANLGELVGDLGSDAFRSPGDLFEELQAALPVEAVGEPGQSEGDA